MKVNMLMGKNMGKVNSNGLTDLNLKATSMITILKVKDNIVGQTEENIKVNGNQIKWREKELLLGQMEEYIMDHI